MHKAHSVAQQGTDLMNLARPGYPKRRLYCALLALATYDLVALSGTVSAVHS